MNKDQVKGRLKEAAGDVQKNVGRAVDNKSQESKGRAREIEGKVQKTVGDAKDKVEDLADNIKKKNDDRI